MKDTPAPQRAIPRLSQAHMVAALTDHMDAALEVWHTQADPQPWLHLQCLLRPELYQALVAPAFLPLTLDIPDPCTSGGGACTAALVPAVGAATRASNTAPWVRYLYSAVCYVLSRSMTRLSRDAVSRPPSGDAGPRLVSGASSDQVASGDAGWPPSGPVGIRLPSGDAGWRLASGDAGGRRGTLTPWSSGYWSASGDGGWRQPSGSTVLRVPTSPFGRRVPSGASWRSVSGAAGLTPVSGGAGARAGFPDDEGPPADPGLPQLLQLLGLMQEDTPLLPFLCDALLFVLRHSRAASEPLIMSVRAPQTICRLLGPTPQPRPPYTLVLDVLQVPQGPGGGVQYRREGPSPLAK